MATSTNDDQKNSLEEIEEDSPSILFAVIVGSVSVVGGFELVHWLGAKAKPTLAPWLIARGTGLALVIITSLLVAVGLWMVHPKRNKRKSFPHIITLNSAHKSLAGVGSVLLFLHVSSIIADSFAKVGLLGAFVPLKSAYRPIPVALGTVALYLCLAVGFTAWLKVRTNLFNWKMVHRFAIAAYCLILVHGITAGSDTVLVSGIYVASAIVITILATTRYLFDHKEHQKQAATAKN